MVRPTSGRGLPLLFTLALLAPPVAAAAPPCADIEGIAPLLGPGRILLLGEMHGTQESPRFVGDVACQALAAGLGVTVGLELPQADQGRVDAYLESAGRPEDVSQLYSPFWTKDYQDGRSSEAMAGLLDRLRQMRRAGRPLRVVLIDRPEAGRGRDEAMAHRLAAAREAAPKDLLLVLTGNMHNRTRPGAPWNQAYEPMGYRLGKLLPEVGLASLDVSYTGGTAWVCLAGEPCGVQSLGGRGEGDTVRVTLFETADEKGFHGRYDVGAITASLPAAAGKAPAGGASD